LAKVNGEAQALMRSLGEATDDAAEDFVKPRLKELSGIKRGIEDEIAFKIRDLEEQRGRAFDPRELALLLRNARSLLEKPRPTTGDRGPCNHERRPLRGQARAPITRGAEVHGSLQPELSLCFPDGSATEKSDENEEGLALASPSHIPSKLVDGLLWLPGEDSNLRPSD
jgi:hypothetical protein